MRKFLRQCSMIAIALVMIGGFAIAETVDAATTTAPQTAQQGASSQSKAPEIDVCSFTSPSTWAFGCFYGAIGKLIWGVIIPITGWLLWLVGQVLDFALNLQFASDFFKSTAIAAGWTIIRDLCNMVFIFVLIYAGIATILNLSSANLKKVITGVIISALFINFSLFITRAIIDVSNVATAWFVQGVKNVGGGVGVSDSVQGVLQMKKLIEGNATPKENVPIGLSTFVTGIAVLALNVVAIYMFFKVAFVFIARIVSFMFLLVTAPIGFVGGLGIGKLDELSKEWWNELRCQAFMAPMFFLMLYLTLYIVDQVQVLVFTAGAGTTDPITGGSFSPANYLMFAIIIMMLLKTLSIAEESGCKLGNQIAGALKGAVGLATGTLAMGTLGRAAGAVANNERFQSWAARSGVVGTAAMKATMGTASSSFGAASSYKNLGVSKLGIPGTSDAFKGADKGYAGLIKKEAEDRKTYAKAAFGKGPKGAKNRQAYAEGVNSGIWGQVVARNPIINPLRWKDTAATAASAIGSASLHGAPGINAFVKSKEEKTANEDLLKDAKSEYAKEAGKVAENLQGEMNKKISKDPEIQRIEDERHELQTKLDEEIDKAVVLEKEKLEGAVAEEKLLQETFKSMKGDESNYEQFKQRYSDSKKATKAAQEALEEAKKNATNPEIESAKEQLDKKSEEVDKLKLGIINEQIKAFESQKVDLEKEFKEAEYELGQVERERKKKDGKNYKPKKISEVAIKERAIERVIAAGKKQGDKEESERLKKLIEKGLKDDSAPEKPKEGGGDGAEGAKK